MIAIYTTRSEVACTLLACSVMFDSEQPSTWSWQSCARWGFCQGQRAIRVLILCTLFPALWLLWGHVGPRRPKGSVLQVRPALAATQIKPIQAFLCFALSEKKALYLAISEPFVCFGFGSFALWRALGSSQKGTTRPGATALETLEKWRATLWNLNII